MADFITTKVEYEGRRFTIDEDIRNPAIVVGKIKEMLQGESWRQKLKAVELKSYSHNDNDKTLSIVFLLPVYFADNPVSKLITLVSSLIEAALDELDKPKPKPQPQVSPATVERKLAARPASTATKKVGTPPNRHIRRTATR